MRLRLKCSSAYKLGDLQWCMVHVPEQLHTVRDLAVHISNLLELDEHREGGAGKAAPPQLLLEGFLVPHEEEVRAVLRDDEVVDVEPFEAPSLGLVPLAAQPAWSSPAGVAGGKRPLDAASNGVAAEKRQRGGRKNTAAVAPATMAIGWQSPETSSKAQSAAPAAKAADSEEDEESDEEDEDEGNKKSAAKAAAAPAAGGEANARRVAASAAGTARAAKAEVAAVDAAAIAGEEARRVALATCSDGVNASSASASGSNEGTETGIFVGGLAQSSIDDGQLRKFFEQYGQVVSAERPVNPNGRPKGHAFVEFAQSAARAHALSAGPKVTLAGHEVEVKPRVAKGSGKAKGKESKGKDSKGGGKNKSKGKGKDKAQTKKNESSSEGEESSSEEEEAPKKVAAPTAKAVQAQAAPKQPAPAAKAALEISQEELDTQRQMAALGLPVSFTASEMAGGEEDDDDSDEDDEEDGEA